MIKVFNETDTIFETNGEVVLNPTYANVHKEDNGDYYLDLETSIEEDKIKHIEHEEGTTIETTGTTLTDVDTTKENKFISLYGETQQDSTTGKNLLGLVDGTYTKNSVTATVKNGVITLSGTNSSSGNFTLQIPTSTTLQNSTEYIFRNDCNKTMGSNAVQMRYFLGDSSTSTTVSSGDVTKTTLASGTYFNVYVRIAGSYNTNDYVIKPMIRLSSITDNSYEQYTGGSPAPSPSYPFDIHNVNGDNTIEICGKNLFDGTLTPSFTPSGTNWYSLDGINNFYNETQVAKSNCYFDFKAGTTYAISVNSLTNLPNIQVCNSSGTAIVSNFNDYAIYTPQVDIRGWFRSKPTNANTVTQAIIQIEKNNQPTTYQPYTNQTQLISLGVENLFNKDNANVLNASVGSSNISASTNAKTLYISIQGGMTYTISKTLSARFRIGTTTETPIVGSTISNFEGTDTVTKKTITTSSNAKYLCVYYFLNGTDTLTEQQILDSIQIEKGSKANSYSEYGKPYIELCKISTYQDYIHKQNDRWYLHKEIGKVVLDGVNNSFTVKHSSIYSSTKGFYRVELPNKTTSTSYPSGSTNAGYCDLFSYKSGGAQTAFDDNSNGIWWERNTKRNYIILEITTLEAANEWLKTHNTTIYYILDTPTDTEITDTTLLEQLNNFEKMKLYKGITNISITPNDLTPTLKLHYNYMTGGDVVINNNDYIKSNNIIVANTPTGEQAFRITDIEKRKHKIVLKAWHISYDTQNYVIQDSYVVDKTCNQAMDHLNNATDNTSPFTTTSDITTINSYRCVRRSLFEAFNVVLERWGGHFVRDNWNFKIMNSIGQDNGVVVRYAKNLKDIQVNYDWTNVVTKILPVGNDGLLLDEVFLYADIQYDIPYTKVIHFDQNIDDEPYRDEDGNLDEEAYKQALKNDLRTQATAYLQEHYIPQVNYELNANLEKITDIGDTIQVKDERLGIDLLTNLISYDYDCILEKYKTLEFGNFRKTISDLTTYINAQTTQIVDDSVATTRITLQNELETATSQIWGVLGNSYVIVEGDKILIVDSLPKETATNVWMFNNGGLAFSNTGINGTFKQAWTIDGTFNTQNINVINFTADLIKGGTLKLGSNVNQNGILEVYDEANNLIALLNKDGLRMNAVNGDYVLINQNVGFAGFDRNDNKIYWADGDEFHMKKSVVEEEITLVDKMRIIPITITENNIITHDGIGFVSTL